jgi:hypothetical protein
MILRVFIIGTITDMFLFLNKKNVHRNSLVMCTLDK